MKQTVDFYDFRDAFIHASRKENFSYVGLEVLFDYLEEIAPDYDLDVIGLCCEFEEASLDEINEQYSQEFEDIEEAADWLADQTSVCGTTDDSVIFVQF